MTHQIPTIVRFQGADFELAECDGALRSGFDPETHGLTRVFAGTHCWESYHLGYVVEPQQDRLYLDRIDIAVSRADGERAPLLFGREALRGEASDGGVWLTYRDLQQRIEFTGSLLIGRDHSGAPLQPHAFCYAAVTELVFDAGALTGVSDVTDEMCRLRQRWEDRPSLSMEGLTGLEQFVLAREQSAAYWGCYPSRRALANESSRRR